MSAGGDTAAGPRGDQAGGVIRIGGSVEEVIGTGKGDETFRVAGSGVDAAGVFERDDAVARGVHDEEFAVEGGDGLLVGEVFHIIKKTAADGELAAGKGDGGFALAADGFQIVGDEVDDVGRIRRGTDGGDGAALGDVGGRGEHSGTAEAVADEEGGRAVMLAQPVCGDAEVLDIR